ncbi:hypothetical protein [Methylobacillus sp.]|nr:hypothetical protein [Methylobacillus sp.]
MIFSEAALLGTADKTLLALLLCPAAQLVLSAAERLSSIASLDFVSRP